jgi:hypothetical protein
MAFSPLDRGPQTPKGAMNPLSLCVSKREGPFKSSLALKDECFTQGSVSVFLGLCSVSP